MELIQAWACQGLYDLPKAIGHCVGRMNYRRAEGRRQSRIVEETKDVEREDLWRFVMNNDLISLSIDNRLY
jgi:hypothetical protein